MDYPLRHISIRVPWHDTGWDGRVCAAPRLNGACLKLKRTAEDRDDAEEAIAGTHGILPREERSGENGTLIITRDEANGSIDSAKITKLIEEVLG